MTTRSYTRRPPTQDRVTDGFVQLQAKVPPEVRPAWQQAAHDNHVSLSLLFQGLKMTAEKRGITLGELLAPLVPDELRGRKSAPEKS